MAELRAHPTPVQAQLTLDGRSAEDTPWAEPAEAHRVEPPPNPVLRVLASRPGCPTTLLPSPSGEGRHRHLSELASQSPESARIALTRLSEADPAPCGTSVGATRPTIHAVRSARLLDDRTILATARPASAALPYGRDLPTDAPDGNSWSRLRGEHLTSAARRFGPGFWQLLADDCPPSTARCSNSSPRHRARPTSPHSMPPLRVLPSDPRHSPSALLGRYESQVRTARRAPAGRRSDAQDARNPRPPGRLGGLDTEPTTLVALARAATTVRPEFTISLPEILSPHPDSPDRVAELIPLVALAQQTAARIGDQYGEAVAWSTAGLATRRLRRYEEAAAVGGRPPAAATHRCATTPPSG
ncbi:hypothetical protein [Streptomyces roseolus]